MLSLGVNINNADVSKYWGEYKLQVSETETSDLLGDFQYHDCIQFSCDGSLDGQVKYFIIIYAKYHHQIPTTVH